MARLPGNQVAVSLELGPHSCGPALPGFSRACGTPGALFLFPDTRTAGASGHNECCSLQVSGPALAPAGREGWRGLGAAGTAGAGVVVRCAPLPIHLISRSREDGAPEPDLCFSSIYCPQLWGSHIHRVRPLLPSLTSTWQTPLHASKSHQISPLLWNRPCPLC